MKHAMGFGAAAVVLAGVWSGLSIPGLAQSPVTKEQTRVFRYAYVTPSHSRERLGAEICYAEPAGCRIELVTVPNVELASTFGGIDAGATTSRAMVKADTGTRGGRMGNDRKRSGVRPRHTECGPFQARGIGLLDQPLNSRPGTHLTHWYWSGHSP